MKKKKRKGRVLIITGILLLAGALGLTLHNMKESNDAKKASDSVLVQMEKLIDTDETDEKNQFPVEREMPTIRINGYDYIGYLSVPSLNLTLPVMDTWDYERLKIAPCRYSGSLYKRNLVIAGHNYRAHFSPLRSLNPGTKILFTDAEGHIYHYHIADLTILNPIQIEDLIKDSNEWDLTLFTCTIGGQTRHTIRCVLDD
ncbi:MAG: sortase [Eubacteriales bacterium]|nr:sortase [Eubacteriales bacterium]